VTNERNPRRCFPLPLAPGLRARVEAIRDANPQFTTLTSALLHLLVRGVEQMEAESR